MKNILTMLQKYRLEYQSKFSEYKALANWNERSVLCSFKGYSFLLQRITDFTLKIQVFAHRVTVFKKFMLAALCPGQSV